MAQILFNTWGIENAVQKIADLMRQDRRKMQNITKIVEEDLVKAKEKMTEWFKEKEKPAVKKVEPNFFEEGVELKEDALNVNKQRDEETLKQASARKRNEEADKRAVEAAARNAAPNELAERRKKIVKIGNLIQTMMLQIMEKKRSNYEILGSQCQQ